MRRRQECRVAGLLERRPAEAKPDRGRTGPGAGAALALAPAQRSSRRSGAVDSLAAGDTSGIGGIEHSVQQTETNSSAPGTKIIENANPSLG